MHRRNFGLGHLHPKALRERLHNGLTKRAAEPAPVISIRLQYLGRDVFFHGENTYTPERAVGAQSGGKS